MLRFASLLLGAFPVLGVEEPPKVFVDGLTSEDFTAREKSQKDLLDWCREKRTPRAAAVSELSTDEDPEIRKRASEILRELSDEDYLSEGQGYLGVSLLEEMLNAGPDGKARVGVRILAVLRGSPADTAGLKEGDLILAIDGKSWTEAGAINVLMDEIAKRKPLVNIVLTVSREAPEPLEITAKLGKRPIPDLRAATGDLQMLDKQAKDEHFRQWLKLQKEQRE